MRAGRALFASAILLTCIAAAALAQSNDLGSINHVRILVHDVQASQEVYSNLLGFTFPRPTSVFPEGSIHQGTPFQDFTYLELIAVADREKLLKARPWIVEFLDKFEGAHSIGFKIRSAEELSARLGAQHIEAPISKLSSSTPGAKPFLHVTPKLKHLPEGVVFFTEYPPRTTPPPKLPPESNGTETLTAAWIVVKDLPAAASDFQALGFAAVRSFTSDTLHASGQQLAAAQGSIVLLHPNGDGPVQQFANKRGEGVMGVTLTVQDLSKTAALIEKNSKHMLASYRGLYGDSVLVPGELAQGVWMEFVQVKPPSYKSTATRK